MIKQLSCVPVLFHLLMTPSLAETFYVHSENENDGQCSINQMQSPETNNAEVCNNLIATDNHLFVITTIFNPASYKSRYELYHQFVQHMTESGAQLITIECIFPGLNQTEFQVTSANNPFHIQMKSNNVYYMQENLINIAVSRLPSCVKWIAWVDADLSFRSKNWVNHTLTKLQKYLVVQMAEKIQYLGPDGQVIMTRNSFAHNHLNNIRRYGFTGGAWAMSKSSFLKIKGLSEFEVLGGADTQFAYSLTGDSRYKFSKSITLNLAPEFWSAIKAMFAKRYADLNSLSAIERKEILSYNPITVNHFWHGSRTDRKHLDRWRILISHKFNYNNDVKKRDDGLLEFITKPGTNLNGRSSLEHDIQFYFEGRNEDKNIVPLSDYNSKLRLRFSP